MPFTYSDEQKAAMMDRIIDGLSDGVPLAELCRDKNMPCRRHVYQWKDEDPAFGARFAQARELGFEAIATNLRATARGAGEATGDVLRDKLIIETDLKLLAKWSPKIYGDRTVVAGDPDAPLQVAKDPVATILALIQIGAERARLEDQHGGDLA